MPLVPVLQRARLREQGGLPGRPLGGGATQVNAVRRGGREGAGISEEPRLALAQAKEGHGAGAIAERGSVQRQQAAIGIGEGTAIRVQHDHLRLRP
jgi:hypothetical protein